MQILFENNHFIVAIKPFGKSTQSDTKGVSFLDDVKKFIRERDKKNNPFIALVHRLDRDVGGLIIFAKNSKTATRLANQILQSRFKKLYIAEVYGAITAEQGYLEHYLGRDKKDRRSTISINKNKHSKLAQLNYYVLYKSRVSTIVQIELLTGRYHQIRAQFAQIGHPLIGDKVYGNQQYNITRQKYYKENDPEIHLSTEFQFSIQKKPLPVSINNFWDLFSCKFEFQRPPIHLVSSIVGFDNVRAD